MNDPIGMLLARAQPLIPDTAPIQPSETCLTSLSLLTAVKRFAGCFLDARRAGPTLADRRAASRTLLQLETAMRRSPNGAEVNLNVQGHSMHGFDAGMMKFLFDEVFLRQDYRCDLNVPDPIIVDCGANIGFSVLYLKILYPEARIHAFEADPRIARVLEQNVATNGLRDVIVHSAALTDREGEIAFYVEPPGGLRSSLRADRGGTERLIVRAERLSATLTSLERVDLVKMDVEGAEWEILADLRESGALTKPRQYIIEYHHQISGGPPRLSEFLFPFEQSGFRYQIGGHRGNPPEFQDILVHLTRR
jgi:FkbM family methyltransferase